MLLYDSRFSGREGLDIGGVWAERAGRFPPPASLADGEEPSLEWLAAKRLSEPVPVDWDGDAEYYSYETTLPPAVAWNERARPGPGYRRKQTWIIDRLTGEDLAAAEAARDPVPASVQMWQARTVLGRMGLVARIDGAIAGMPEPQRSDALAQWEYAPNLLRDAAFVAALAPALSLTDPQIDNLFRQAAQVR